jgi:STE24 endopeptidase
MKLALLGFIATLIIAWTCSTGASGVLKPDPSKYFTQDELQRAKAYSRIGTTLWLARVAGMIALLALLIYTGAARYAEQLISARIPYYILRVFVYFVAIYLLYSLIFFPITLYRSYIIEHQFGFSNQTFSQWLWDFLRANTISMVFAAILVVGLYWLIKVSPRWWWLIGTAGFAVYMAGVILIKPVVIDPVFNKFTPIQDEKTEAQIIELAGKADIEVGEVLVMDASRRTTHTNAYFTGFGHTKRIVVYDNLLKEHSQPEVLSVIAHEIGHWKYAHIYKGFFMAVAGTCLVLLIVKLAGGLLVAHMPLGTDTLASPATMPLVFIILYICSLLAMPVENGISRSFERQADRTALELTGDGRTFVEMQVKLARTNASDPQPHILKYLWLYTHPSTMERIAVGKDYGG